MAQAKKKTAAKAGTSAKKRTGNNTSKKNTSNNTSGRKTAYAKQVKQNNEAKAMRDGGIRKEILILMSLAIALILFFGVLDMAGSFGTHLHNIQFGLFGTMAWTFPFLLFWAICFLISNGDGYRKAAIFKVIMSIITFAALCGILEMIGGRGIAGDLEILDYYDNTAEGINGGLIGGALFQMLYSALGAMGTYVILVAAVIIGFVFITGRSFIQPIHRGSKKVVDTAKEDFTRIREKQAIRSAQKREQRRVDQKVQGVALDDTDLTEAESDRADGYDAVDMNGIYGEMPAAAHVTAAAEETYHMEDKSVHGSDMDEYDAEENDPVNLSDPFVIRRERRTLTELDELDARLRGEPDEMEDDYRLWSDTVADTEIKINIGEYLDEEDYVTFTPEAVDIEVEDPMAAYDAFDTPSPETVVREVTEPGTQIRNGSSAADSIWKQGSNKDGSSGVTFRGSTSATVQPITTPPPVKKEYKMPSTRMLKSGPKQSSGRDGELKATAVKLQQTLRDFGVGVTVTDISCGPSVTRYELHPEQGVKVSRIVALADDIKLNLAAADIRIEAPIPGKAAVGIEVPNSENQTVFLRDLIESAEFRKFPSKLGFAVGRDISGKVIVADLARMPHLLIAGATGSGKSVCINTLIMSILYKAKPDEVKLILIDPKVVELSIYNGIPHLMIPVVTDPKKAAGALNWAVAEMTDRYKKFAEMSVRDIKGYNNKVEESGDEELEKMPQIVVIVDELADLMMVASGEVEEAICRLAQLARAAGIHLVLATQRPSVNVITGLIKANVPSRIAFAVSSGVDSRTIIDMVGAEKLLGKGDMLFYPTGYPKPVRVQGAFVSDEEVGNVTKFLTGQTDGDVKINQSLEKHMTGAGKDEGSVGSGDRDEYFERCGRFIIEKDKASIGNLQRAFKIGFNRAARIMDQLAGMGVVGPEEGTKPRQILMTMEEFEELLSNL